VIGMVGVGLDVRVLVLLCIAVRQSVLVDVDHRMRGDVIGISVEFGGNRRWWVSVPLNKSIFPHVVEG